MNRISRLIAFNIISQSQPTQHEPQLENSLHSSPADALFIAPSIHCSS